MALWVNEWRVASEHGAPSPHPGCFAKRGWIRLIAKELTFLERAKRLQVAEKKRESGKRKGHGGRGKAGWKKKKSLRAKECASD
jgi:hypothetical protein